MTIEEQQVQIDVLRKELYRYADRMVLLEKWVDTFSSPLYKRLWFFLRGYRWRTLGRWRGSDLSQWPPATEGWWRS